MTGLSFGSYVLVVEAVNSGNLSLGRSSSQNVVLDGTSCDSMSGTDCVKNLAVAIKLD